MRYETWMKETNRGIWKPRSKALKALDKAFARCGDSAVGHSINRRALLEKLIAWIGTKRGNWQNSIRNTRQDGRGKGTVERLLDSFASDPNYAPMLVRAGILTPPRPTAPAPRPIPPLPRPIPPLPRPIPPLPAHAIPPGEAYRPGKIDRKKDCDGQWRQFIRQEKGNSCVPATITMMKRAWSGANFTDLNESQIRGLMGLIEKGRMNQGVSAISDYAQNAHNWAVSGTTAELAVKVLKANPFPVRTAYSIKAALMSRGKLFEIMQNLTPKKPGLIGWYWRGGGGHATLCIGPSKDGTRLKILDPWDGIQYVTNTLADYRTYRPSTGGVGDFGVAVFGK